MRLKPTSKSFQPEFDGVSTAPLADLIAIPSSVILASTPTQQHHFLSESDAELAASSDVERPPCILATSLDSKELVESTGVATPASSVFSLETNPLANPISPPSVTHHGVASQRTASVSMGPSDTSFTSLDEKSHGNTGLSICLTQASFVSSQLCLKDLTQGKKGSVVIELHGPTFVVLTPKAILRTCSSPQGLSVEALWPAAYCPISLVQNVRVRVKAYGLNFSEHILAETIVSLPHTPSQQLNLRFPLNYAGELNLTFTTGAERPSTCTSSRSFSSSSNSTSFPVDFSPKTVALRAMARNQSKMSTAPLKKPHPGASRTGNTGDGNTKLCTVSCWSWLRKWRSSKIQPGSKMETFSSL